MPQCRSGAAPLREACAEMAPALAALELGVPEFGDLYPEESAAWNVATADPVLDLLLPRGRSLLVRRLAAALSAELGRALRPARGGLRASGSPRETEQRATLKAFRVSDLSMATPAAQWSELREREALPPFTRTCGRTQTRRQ